MSLTNRLRELEIKDQRSMLQRRYYTYIKEPKSIDQLPKISIRGDNLPKNQLRKIVKKWLKRLKLEKYLVIIEEVPAWDYNADDVESHTCAKLWVIDENGERVETQGPIVQLDAKRVQAGDFVLIYIMFYLLNWKTMSLRECEENVLHELLHVKYPDKNENWIRKKTSELLKRSS